MFCHTGFCCKMIQASGTIVACIRSVSPSRYSSFTLSCNSKVPDLPHIVTFIYAFILFLLQSCISYKALHPCLDSVSPLIHQPHSIMSPGLFLLRSLSPSCIKSSTLIEVPVYVYKIPNSTWLLVPQFNSQA